MRNKVLFFLLVLICAINAALSGLVPGARAQFIDRLIRPCQTGGVSGSVIVTTTNITMTPCPGGSVTINGVPITPGAGYSCPGCTVNTLIKATGANTAGNSGATDSGTVFDIIRNSVRLGDPLEVTRGTWITLNNTTGRIELIGNDANFSAGLTLQGDDASAAATSAELRTAAGSRVRLNVIAGQAQLDNGFFSLTHDTTTSIWKGAGAHDPIVTLDATNRKITLLSSNTNSTQITVDDVAKTAKLFAGAGGFAVLDAPGVQFTGKLVFYNNVAPADGQILIGGTATGNWTAGTISGSAPIVVTNGNNTIAVSCPTCGTGSGTVTGTGTTNTLPKWTNGASGVLGDARLTDDGTTVGIASATLALNATVTAGGTTGAQTINKSAGSVNFAAAATSLVVTDNVVTANSIIQCTIATNDTTMKSVQCVAAAGSFTIFSNAAATAETRVNFFVITPQ